VRYDSDSPEVGQVSVERGTRWQERATEAAGYVLLSLVVISVAAMSFTGLVGFGRDVLHLSGLAAAMVPVSLDMAAMSCGALGLRSVAAGESAAGARCMLAAFVIASASANYLHAERAYGDTAAALFFGSMSVAAVAMFDLVLRSLRRAALRSIGAIERPLPRFRAVRWLRFPRETFGGWSMAVRFGLTRPDDALALVWERAEVRAAVDARDADLAALSKAEALRTAFAAVGRVDVPAALGWLRERSVKIDRGYAYELAKTQRAPGSRALVGRNGDGG
jgi:Protein of unknown function (DUF2637)